MRIRLLAATSLALLVAGCGQTASGGSSSFSGQEKAVADKVGDLSKAAGRRQSADICSKIVTADLAKRIAAGNRDCAEELEKALKDADAFDLDVTDVTISGTTAKARVKTTNPGDQKDVVRTLTLSRGGGGWRVSDFG